MTADQWVKCSDQLPKAEQFVLAYFKNECGKDRRIRAFYAPRFTVESSCADGEADEYDEAKDDYYLKEGWYEANEYEEVHWFVHASITHWMPLPEPPNG